MSSPKKKDKKWSWKKPQGKPKRPPSAYNLFYKDFRHTLILENWILSDRSTPQPKDGKGLGGATKLTNLVSEQWQNLDDVDEANLKPHYQGLANIRKAEYLRVLAEWKKEQSQQLQRPKSPPSGGTLPTMDPSSSLTTGSGGQLSEQGQQLRSVPVTQPLPDLEEFASRTMGRSAEGGSHSTSDWETSVAQSPQQQPLQQQEGVPSPQQQQQGSIQQQQQQTQQQPASTLSDWSEGWMNRQLQQPWFPSRELPCDLFFQRYRPSGLNTASSLEETKDVLGTAAAYAASREQYAQQQQPQSPYPQQPLPSALYSTGQAQSYDESLLQAKSSLGRPSGGSFPTSPYYETQQAQRSAPSSPASPDRSRYSAESLPFQQPQDRQWLCPPPSVPSPYEPLDPGIHGYTTLPAYRPQAQQAYAQQQLGLQAPPSPSQATASPQEHTMTSPRGGSSSSYQEPESPGGASGGSWGNTPPR